MIIKSIFGEWPVEYHKVRLYLNKNNKNYPKIIKYLNYQDNRDPRIFGPYMYDKFIEENSNKLCICIYKIEKLLIN